MRAVTYTLKLKFIVIALLVVFLIMTYATWREMVEVNHVISAMLSLLLIIVIIGFTVSKIIDRPIQKIVNAIKKVQEGDLSVRIDMKQNDEMGQLADSFNNMVESLDMAKKEIEMCHSRQIERAAKFASLGEMASAIAHEIKNPLTGISSAVQVLVAELDEGDPKKKIMVEVLNQVKRLDRAVRDLLAYARPKPPSLSYHDINSVIEKALFFIQQIAKREHTNIVTRFDRHLPEIMVDADQLQQVFINIAINAIQAMPEGGKFEVSTALLSHAQEASFPDILDGKSDWIWATFTDSGVGIPLDDINKIFDPFFTKKGKGTGLGLSISQRIIDEHGGRIIVSSEAGKGSIFSVYLPVKKDADTTRFQS